MKSKKSAAMLYLADMFRGHDVHQPGEVAACGSDGSMHRQAGSNLYQTLRLQFAEQNCQLQLLLQKTSRHHKRSRQGKQRR